jgi:hypothetical protein
VVECHWTLALSGAYVFTHNPNATFRHGR